MFEFSLIFQKLKIFQPLFCPQYSYIIESICFLLEILIYVGNIQHTQDILSRADYGYTRKA